MTDKKCVSATPADTDENILLSSIITGGNECYNEIIDILNESIFNNYTNRKIFNICKALHDESKQINPASVLSMCAETNISVDHIINTPTLNVDQIKDLGLRIQNAFLKKHTMLEYRKLIDDIDQLSATEIGTKLLASIESIHSAIISKLSGISSDIINLKDVTASLVEYWATNPSENVGLPTPWPKFNESIGGGMRTGVTLIGARSGVGKTSIAVMVANFLATLNIPVLLLDTEMEYKDIIPRVLANLSEISIRDIETGVFANSDFDKRLVSDAVEVLENSKFYYKTIAGKSFDEILSIVRKWIYTEVGTTPTGKANQCLVIYDYFKIMDSAEISDMQEYQAMGFQISKLTDFCKKFDLPCLSFVQLNRDGVAKEGTDVIAQSDRLLWLCNSFSIFKSKSKDELDAESYENGNRKLITLKSRYGGEHSPGEHIPMHYHGATCTLKEVVGRINGKNEIV